MADHHYLPAFDKKNTNLTTPANGGWWAAVSKRDIGALSQGLEVDKAARKRAATSLPDVWARPLLFHSAIRPNSKHPLSDELTEEWRGLLSLIALSQYYGKQIQFGFESVPVDVTSGGRLARALTDLCPSPVQLERGMKYDWLDLLVLRVDGVAVGALSPLTLAYTGVRDLPGGLPLVDKETGRLRQPDDPTEQRYVAQWLKQLLDRISPMLWFDQDNNADHQVVGDIRTLLVRWLASLRRTLGLSETDPLEQAGVELRIADVHSSAAAWPRLQTYGLYRELLRPLEVEQKTGRRSDLLLKASRGAVDREVVVIASYLLALDVKVWNTLKSKDLGAIDDVAGAMERYFAAESGTRIKGDNLAESHAFWIRPELYFLNDSLLFSPTDAPLIASSEIVAPQKDRRFIYPFRREILDFFSPADVAQLNPRFDPIDNGYRFTFTLPLDSSVRETISVHKDYRFKDPKPGDGTVRRFDPPAAYVFPRFRTRHWRRYFLFVSGDASTIKPLMDPGANAAKPITRSRGDATIYQLAGDGVFPEALSVSGADGKAAGLVLLNKPDEQQGLAGDREMIIGVDYGTSNTSVFILPPGSDTPRPWTIDLRRNLLPVFECDGAADLLQQNFLPLKPVELPIATNLRVLDPAIVEHLLLDYFIYFSDDYRLPDNVHSDIKWQDIAKTQQFIKSLLLLLLLEVVEERAKKLKIIFSYPKAFSDDQRDQLKAVWNQAIEDLTKSPDRILTLAVDGSDPDIMKPIYGGIDRALEAVAVGEFFASRTERAITIPRQQDRAKIATTAVCIDVGGGTTDICIWYNNRRVLDASILLAGRQVGSWIRSNATVRELLLPREAALALKEVETKPALFSGRLNQILRREEDKLATNLIMHGMHPEVARLRRMLTLEFGAIVYYTATLLIAANKKVRIRGEIADRVGKFGIQLHWGGNAAKMLGWIDKGRFAEDGMAAEIMRGIFRNALADGEIASSAKLVGNKLSPRIKSEVAGGLIAWDEFKEVHAKDDRAESDDPDADEDLLPIGGKAADGSESEAGLMIHGDALDLVDRTILYDEPVAATSLFSANGDTAVRNIPMDRLARFLEITNHKALSKGLIDEGHEVRLTDQLRAHVGPQVLGEFITMAGLLPAKRVIEPVFISEIKSLLSLLSQQG